MNTTTADDSRLRVAHRLGTLPLMVLAADSSVAADWRAAQEAQARLSDNSQLVIVSQSSHFVSFDQPQAIIDAIEQVLDSARTGQPL